MEMGNMFVRRIMLQCVLAGIVFFAQSAQAFFDPPWITPASPVAGEVVSVNIRHGICDSIIGREGFPRITQDGSDIRIVYFGVHYEINDELCIYGIGTVTKEIGSFPAGSYTLSVDLVYENPFTGQPEILGIGIVPFNVAGLPETASVPSGGAFSMWLLLIGILIVALWSMRKRSNMLIILLLTGLPLSIRAQDTQVIEILPLCEPGTSTPEQIVAWIKASPRSATPPLQAFGVVSPIDGDFLIPDRATGDFLAWLNNNPNSARRKLECATYGSFLVEDIPAALAALQADPQVAYAAILPTYELHSVELIDFGIEPAPLSGQTQYGLYDMAVDLAWRWAGGVYARRSDRHGSVCQRRCFPAVQRQHVRRRKLHSRSVEGRRAYGGTSATELRSGECG